MTLVYGLLDLKSTNLLLPERIEEEGAFHFFVEGALAGADLSEADARKPSRGQAAADVLGAGAHVVVRSGHGAKKLPDFLSNSLDLLIVHKRVKQIFERVNEGNAEYLPLALHDPSHEVRSRDYFIVNPLGVHDVLDAKASRLKWDSPMQLYRLGFVLDRAKVLKAPEVFRVKGHPTTYVISKKIATELRKLSPKVTNLHYLEIYEVE